MRCHYEVLGLGRDATEAEIKKAHRRMALKHHPDKNLGREEEAAKVMVVIQQAYDCLSDPQDRAWYDRHREAILRGGVEGDFKDDALNLFPFFAPSAYRGFGDGSGGFFTVYRDVFATVAQEDAEFFSKGDDGEEPSDWPVFGDAASDYESVVAPFYAFWCAYSTLRSYAWLDEHDIRQAPNRYVLRQMEKENKKTRETARKERNEKVRELAAYVRRRDPRVKAHKARLEAAAEEQRRKTDAHRLAQLRAANAKADALRQTQCPEEAASHQAKLDDIDSFWGKDSDESSEDGDEVQDEEAQDKPDQPEEKVEEGEEAEALYCPACEKAFKTPGAMSNHLGSKKHREALAKLKRLLQEEDLELLAGLEVADAEPDAPASSKKAKKKKKKAREARLDDSEGEEAGTSKAEEAANPQCSDVTGPEAAAPDTSELPLSTPDAPTSSEAKPAEPSAEAKAQDKPAEAESKPSEPKVSLCEACKEEFPSRSKLFAHLKESGHATLKGLPEQKSAKKNKGQNKRLKR